MLDIKILFTKIITEIKSLKTKTDIASGEFSKINTVTLNSNTTLQKIGSLVVFTIDASTSAQIEAGSSGSGFITFPSGFRPQTAKDFTGRVTSGTIGEFYLNTNGQLQTLTAIPSGATFRISGSFVI